MNGCLVDRDAMELLTRNVSEKNDKITGVKGQLVGFNDNGTAVAEDPTSHFHPIATRIKLAENSWDGTGSITNHIPDTNTWVMSNGRSPDRSGNYEFDATFTSAWEAFSCFFSAELLEWARGRTIRFGTEYLIGSSSRLELIVDSQYVTSISENESPQHIDAEIHATATSVILRIIVFSAEDLHCAFSGIYMYDKDEAASMDSASASYFSVRQIMQNALPIVGVKGTMYITEQGNVYITGMNGQLMHIGAPATNEAGSL